MPRQMVMMFAVLLAACHSVTPGAGEEAVLIMQPVIFGSGGVHPTPIKTGQAWVAPTTQAVIVNMQPELFRVHFEDLMSSDGVPLDFDAVIRMQVINSVPLVSDFGLKWFENNVQPEFMNRVRDAVKGHGMNETAISTKALEDIDDKVTQAMSDYIKRINLPVRLVEVTVGRANPPDAIKHQRVETATQEQRINTERQRKLAEDERAKAELSRAAADNAYRNAMQLSPEQFLRLESIKMQRDVCMAAGTHCSFVPSSAVPTFDLRPR